jgi:hypothetical protein
MTLPFTYRRSHVFRIIPQSYAFLPLVWVWPYCLTIFLDLSLLSPVTATLEGRVYNSFYSLLVSGPMSELQQLQMCSLTLCLLSSDS